MITLPPECDIPPSVTLEKVHVSDSRDTVTGLAGSDIESSMANWVTLSPQSFGQLPPGSVPIRSLDSPSVTIINAIPAQIEIEDGVFVASFVEANINASGETKDEAIEMLKDMVAWTYQLLCQKESALGQQPQRQLAVLRRFVRE